MIEPSIGRKVWYRPNGVGRFDGMAIHDLQPLDATIIYVHGTHMVNLVVCDHNGMCWPITRVHLAQDGEPEPSGDYAEFMPYQKGEAAKAEAPKEQLAEGGTDPHPRIAEETQMINSAVWAAKDILATAKPGSNLYQKAESTADMVLERIRQLMGDSAPAQVNAKAESLRSAARAFGDLALPKAPKLTPAMIENAIVSAQYNVLPGTTVTVCCLELRNGRKVAGINYGPVCPENFSAHEGRVRARAEAFDKLWELEGYLLAQRLYDLHQQLPVAPVMGDTCASDCPSNNPNCPKLHGPCDCKLVDSAISETPEPDNAVMAAN